jgi:hypothetical protein
MEQLTQEVEVDLQCIQHVTLQDHTYAILQLTGKTLLVMEVQVLLL